MNHDEFTRLALSGLLSGSLLLGAGGCQSTGHAQSGDVLVHGCRGFNACKGLGGCKVTQADLDELAKKRGIPAAEAGEPHACRGLNACKGLGGCTITQRQLEELKRRRDEGSGSANPYY